MKLENTVIRTCADEKDGVNLAQANEYINAIGERLSEQGFLLRAAPLLDDKINVYRKGPCTRVMHTSTFIRPDPTRNMRKHGNFYVITGTPQEVADLMTLIRQHRRDFGYANNGFLKDLLDDLQ